MTNSNPIHLDPYRFAADFQRYFKRLPDGNYQIIHAVVLDLKYKPKSGAAGDCWTLSESGQLLLMVGYTWNGPNVVQDAMCKMMAAAVHDVLCLSECLPQYGYWRRQAIYADIMRAQGGGWLLSNLDRAGLLLGQWWPW